MTEIFASADHILVTAIKQTRRSLNFTILGLSHATKIPESTLAVIEAGETRNFDPVKLERISLAFNMETKALLGKSIAFTKYLEELGVHIGVAKDPKCVQLDVNDLVMLHEKYAAHSQSA
jgi:transcriptional regulator with XRE-family HTH domain